jgi:DNA-binding transcriptional MerR regulator
MSTTDGVNYTIGEVAALAHVSVRTLHHYDEIGLLSPRLRTDAGYRRYTAADIERLHQILFYRELGFPLERIADVLKNGDARRHLETQRRLLGEQLARVQAMVSAVDRALEAYDMETPLTAAERFEVFGTFKPEEHEAEVRERWGGTEEFAESQRRVARYSKEDWTRIMAEAGDIHAALKAAMLDGATAVSATAMDLAERHRQHISRWFYECSLEIHCGLGDMYVNDPRFAATYESLAPGLAAYLRDAIVANAKRA